MPLTAASRARPSATSIGARLHRPPVPLTTDVLREDRWFSLPVMTRVLGAAVAVVLLGSMRARVETIGARLDICAGPAGMTGTHGLEPDMLVIGKTIGGGIPAGAYGMSQAVGERVSGAIPVEESDVGGIGGTLAGYALSMAAIRATLGEVLTEDAFARMLPLGERWAAGADEAIAARRVPWHVTRLGARAEYHFMASPPRTGAEQAAHADFELELFLHLWAMNRGILMTPFHNMALMSPATTEADVDRHTEVFADAVEALFG